MLSSFVAGCPTKDSLETCAKHLSTLVNRSTALVAAGVALELVEPIYDFWAWIKRLRFRQQELANFKEVAEFMPTGVQYRRKDVSSDHPRWLKWFGRIGIAFVVLGVIGEARYGADLEDAHSAIHDYDTALLGDAAKSAKTAHDELRSVKQEADELTTRLGKATKQLGGLEKDIVAQGPRWKALNHGQKEFIAALKPFHGQHLTVVVCGQDDSERFPFEQELMNLVRKSEWAVPDFNTWQGCRLSLTGGNEIFVVSSVELWQHAVSYSCHRTHDIGGQGASAAADALCDALNKLRISTTAWTLAPGNQTDFSKESPDNHLPVAVWARGFFGFGTPDSPAELAVREPTKIFILVGPP